MPDSLKHESALKHFAYTSAYFLPEAETADLDPLQAGVPPIKSIVDRSLSRSLGASSWTTNDPSIGTLPQLTTNADPTSELRSDALPNRVVELARILDRQLLLIHKPDLTTVSVVIRPDPKTELNVQFRRQDGEIEALIRCDRGSSELWQQHWPELQSMLAEKSVRLLPIEEQHSTPLHHPLDNNFNPSANSGRQPPSDSHEFHHAPARTVRPRTLAVRESTVSPAPMRRNGWETWA